MPQMGLKRLGLWVFPAYVTTFPIGRKLFQPLEGRLASVTRRGRVQIPPRHIGGGCLPLNGEMVLLIERVLCQPNMSAGSWGEATQRGVKNSVQSQATTGEHGIGEHVVVKIALAIWTTFVLRPQ